MNWHISCVNSYMKLYIISNRLPVKVTKEDETFVFSRSEGNMPGLQFREIREYGSRPYPYGNSISLPYMLA